MTLYVGVSHALSRLAQKNKRVGKDDIVREFPDPDMFFEKHLEQAAEKRIRGFKRAGITRPSWKLVNRLIERDIEDSKQRYIEAGEKIIDHNIKVLIRNYRKRNNQIRRMRTCPPMAALFAFLAWYSFTHSGGFIMGVCYVIASLALLGMLLLGAIFDRPR